MDVPDYFTELPTTNRTPGEEAALIEGVRKAAALVEAYAKRAPPIHRGALDEVVEYLGLLAGDSPPGMGGGS